MRINADFSKAAIVKPEDYHWLKSPGGEVERVMFDRIGNEKARATSLVRYAPQTIFPEHQHPHGEEILVLSGVFTENSTQHYPAGWYLRNPHNSKHTPSSEQGALIFVKLMQMHTSDTASIRIDTNNPKNWQYYGQRFICPLFQCEYENTFLENLKPHQCLEERSLNGMEILIVQGELMVNKETYPTGSWIRLPPNASVNFQAEQSGATLYVKTGHLFSVQKFVEQQS